MEEKIILALGLYEAAMFLFEKLDSAGTESVSITLINAVKECVIAIWGKN